MSSISALLGKRRSLWILTLGWGILFSAIITGWSVTMPARLLALFLAQTVMLTTLFILKAESKKHMETSKIQEIEGIQFS